jgi:hypothetical protein
MVAVTAGRLKFGRLCPMLRADAARKGDRRPQGRDLTKGSFALPFGLFSTSPAVLRAARPERASIVGMAVGTNGGHFVSH